MEKGTQDGVKRVLCKNIRMEIVQRGGRGVIRHHAHYLVLALGEQIQADHLILFVQTADENALNVQTAEHNVNEHDLADDHLKLKIFFYFFKNIFKLKSNLHHPRMAIKLMKLKFQILLIRLLHIEKNKINIIIGRVVTLRGRPLDLVLGVTVRVTCSF